MPQKEFWTEASAAVRARHPGFRLLAEAYWGMEPALLAQGFDWVYDKPLYDALVGGGEGQTDTEGQVRTLLERPTEALSHGMHFVENHDEPRALRAMAAPRSRAAALVSLTLPGLNLLHEGQAEGRRVRLPVQLAREPDEPPDGDRDETAAFYRRLLPLLGSAPMREGEWRLLSSATAWEGNSSHVALLAWCWSLPEQALLVVVNYSGSPAQARLRLPWPGEADTLLVLRDHLSGADYRHPAGELRAEGLYVDLPAWGGHLFSIAPEQVDQLE